MTVRNFHEVHELLARYVPRARSMRGAYTLERMQKLMVALGSPQNSFKSIHVAGTSGKTSTAYYVAAMLHASGQKVGLMVSPHIDEVNERVQIGMQPLDEVTFCEKFNSFVKLVEATGIKPTYFELLVAFGYWVMAQEGVAYVVVEVGLGGLLDGTNVITRPDKTCIITDIGLDHTQVLGRTIPAITSQKAGIIQSHNIVVMYEQSDEIMQVVREVCESEQAELHEVWPLKARELPKSLPLFQRRNWYLALSTYSVLSGRDTLPELNERQLADTAATYIPARMEVIEIAGKIVVLDGAHNAQKLEVLMASIKARYPRRKIAVLFSLLQSKNERLRYSLQPVLSLASRVIITSFTTEYADRKISVSPLKLAEQCDAMGFDNWEIVDDPDKAYRALLARKEDILVITGSFYLLNHIRPLVFADRDRSS